MYVDAGADIFYINPETGGIINLLPLPSFWTITPSQSHTTFSISVTVTEYVKINKLFVSFNLEKQEIDQIFNSGNNVECGCVDFDPCYAISLCAPPATTI